MQNHRSFVPAATWALVAIGVMAAPAHAQLKGFIKSIDTGANQMIVTETGTGTDYPIPVNGRVTVVSVSGKPLTLKDLRKGDGVAVTIPGGIVSKIVADQARLVGTVKSVDVDAKKLVLKPTGATAEAWTSQDITVRVDDQTTITAADGKPIKLAAIKVGDSVSIAHAGDLAEGIKVQVKPDQLTGHVKSIGADLKTFVVTETGTTKDVTIAVNDQTNIVTNEGKALPIKELKEGDGVGITHIDSVAKKVVVNVKP